MKKLSAFLFVLLFSCAALFSQVKYEEIKNAKIPVGKWSGYALFDNEYASSLINFPELEKLGSLAIGDIRLMNHLDASFVENKSQEIEFNCSYFVECSYILRSIEPFSRSVEDNIRSFTGVPVSFEYSDAGKTLKVSLEKFNVETSSSVKKSDFLKSLKEGIDGIVVEVSETGKSLRLTKKGIFICSVTKE